MLIVGAASTRVGKLNRPLMELCGEAIELALATVPDGLPLRSVRDLHGVLSSQPFDGQVMAAHGIASYLGLPVEGGGQFIARTLDVGGASPVGALGMAESIFRQHPHVDVLAVVCGDVLASGVGSPQDFARKVEERSPRTGTQGDAQTLPALNYDRFAQHFVESGRTTREQLAAVRVLMGLQAAKHPGALDRRVYDVDKVLKARPLGRAQTVLEVARRADGAACVLVCSDRFMAKHAGGLSRALLERPPIRMVGYGEASSTFVTPGPTEPVPESRLKSIKVAADEAFAKSGLKVEDVDFFFLYDCFPVAFVNALEEVGLAAHGEGGKWVEEAVQRAKQGLVVPVNTHGGLMAHGAPWEAPALFGVVECVEQLRGQATGRQVPGARRGFVYGNGGIFSASTVAILKRDESFGALQSRL